MNDCKGNLLCLGDLIKILPEIEDSPLGLIVSETIKDDMLCCLIYSSYDASFHAIHPLFVERM